MSTLAAVAPAWKPRVLGGSSRLLCYWCLKTDSVRLMTLVSASLLLASAAEAMSSSKVMDMFSRAIGMAWQVLSHVG